jgi:hypothetical protein
MSLSSGIRFSRVKSRSDWHRRQFKDYTSPRSGGSAGQNKEGQTSKGLSRFNQR